MRTFPSIVLSALALLPGSAAFAADVDSDADVARCADYDTRRNVYWGDLHVHTAISMDAYIFDTRLGPDESYRFARGEEVNIAPLDAAGTPTAPVQIDRPLDFAAVTDHAHSFGGVRLCTKPGSPVYDSEICRDYRRPFTATNIKEGTDDIVKRVANIRTAPICGEDGSRCRDAALEVWQDTQRAAALHDDDAPSCRFTTFVAYEHTANPQFTKIHRNVIFRNEIVPELPITYYDEPSARGLWRELERQCLDAGTGCDALAIPHNPNLSNGQLFGIEYPEGSSLEEQAAMARQRATLEPVVEMSQKKGDSECRNGMWKVLGSDEQCEFEKIRSLQEVPDCEDGKGWGALAQQGCVSRLDYARYALIEGLREADRIGVNPYAFGMIAATDIHTGTPGLVDEREYAQMGPGPQGVGNNLGGLAAVWAEENSREAIFEALRRREVYGTSGPRMSVRFFGGWSYPDDLCERAGFVEWGYAGGVPMGSDLAPRTGDATAPAFAVSALRDPGTAERPGNRLQRIQIVKGWSDPDGTFHQQVADVAWDEKSAASLDTRTCEAGGSGAESLCAVWRDPDFDAKQRAVYYARVLENPSCRHTGWRCRKGNEAAHTADCEDPRVPKTIQERAWTSPIWYTPSQR